MGIALNITSRNEHVP